MSKLTLTVIFVAWVYLVSYIVLREPIKGVVIFFILYGPFLTQFLFAEPLRLDLDANVFPRAHVK